MRAAVRPTSFPPGPPVSAAAPPAADAFLACLRQSEVVPKVKLKAFLAARGDGGADAQALAAGLVEAGLLTGWQAEKILAGRCRGFRLGSYNLLGLLGKGGMSAVYLGEHVVMKRRCAIKVLPAKLVGGGSHLERFLREARAVAALDHPNIVRAYDVASEGSGKNATHYFVMELVEGRSLYDLVKRDGPPPADRVREIGRESAKGLAHAHAAGIVHRDVKPGNILLAKSGAVKVTDLGLARGEDEELSLTVAHDEKVLGTADYLAPEQALDSHSVDHRADIYGLGCTLYFSLCGHGPFTEGTLTQRLMAHQTAPPPPIETLVGDVPESLAAAIARMLEKKPEDRFQTMDEVAAALADPTVWDEGGPPSHASRVDTAVEQRTEPELSDFLAGLPAEAGSAARSGIVAERGSGTGDTRSATRADRRSGRRTGRPNADPAPEPPSETGPEPGSRSGAFDFLTGVDGGAERSGAGSGVGSGVRSSEGSDGGSDVPAFDAPTPAVGRGNRRGRRGRPGRDEPTPVPADELEADELEDDAEAPPSRPKWPRIAAAAGGLVTAAVVAAVLWGGGDEGRVNPEPVELGTDDDGPLVVGGDQFPTLASALAHVRDLDPADAAEVQVIRLPAGALAERLEVDNAGFAYPSGLSIVGDPAGTTLRPTGGLPAVLLKGPLTRFTLENLTVDAGDRAVAVELSGFLNDVRLSGLTIENLSGTGLALADVGSDGLRIENLKVAAEDGAIGVRIAGSGASRVTFTGGSVAGAGVGFGFAADAERVALEAVAIGPGGVGVRFGKVKLKDITLRDLSLTGLRKGVVFDGEPGRGSGDVVISATNFGDVADPVVVESDLQKVKGTIDGAASTGNAAANPGDDPLGLFD